MDCTRLLPGQTQLICGFWNLPPPSPSLPGLSSARVLFAQAACLPREGRLKPGHGRGWALNPLASEQCRPQRVEDSGHLTFLMPEENGGGGGEADEPRSSRLGSGPSSPRAGGARVLELACGVRCPRPPSPAQPSPQPEPLGSDDGPLTLCPYICPPWPQAWGGQL